MIHYKNNAKPLTESMQHSDHFFMYNGYLLKRALAGQDIYLFSPENVPQLKKAFFSSDNEKFGRLYEEAINNPAIKRNKVSGQEFLSLLIKERMGSGRVYIGFADNMNKYSPYIEEVAPIRMSNLCVEINLPTEPVKLVYNDDGSMNMEGLIALCNLGGINWGAIEQKEDFEQIAYVGLRALDNILSMQTYPFEASRKHNALFRPVGIGIIGLAYWMAKNNVTYSTCYELLDEYADYFAYSITKASIDLAREKGACEGYNRTKWSQGKFPVDNVAPATNEIVQHKVRQHWEELRPLLKEFGIRNSSLAAMMPAETSAKISGRGTTNGIEPVRSLVISKGGKSSKAKFVVPGLPELKDKYDLVWEWQGCSQLIKTYAILQKYTDQAMSCNTYYKKDRFPGGIIPGNVILKDILDAYRYGIKSLYYNNNDDTVDEVQDNKPAIQQVQKPEEAEEEHCESCTL